MSSTSFPFPPPPPPPPKRTADNAARGRARGTNLARGNDQLTQMGSTSQRGYHHIRRGQGGRGDQVRDSIPGHQTWARSTSHRDAAYGSTTLAHSSHNAYKRPYDNAFSQESLSISSTPPNKTKPPNQPTFAASPSTTTKASRLGLIPTNNGSESEDDKDEEADLAKAADGHNLQFEYRGNTSTLQSPADIAAWVAERKKRYPTQAKREAAQREAEEKNRRREEERSARREAAQAARLKKHDELRNLKNPRSGSSQDDSAPGAGIHTQSQSRTNKPGRKSSDIHMNPENAEEGSVPSKSIVGSPKVNVNSTMPPAGSSRHEHNSLDTASESSTVSDSDVTSSSGSDSDDESGPEIVSAKTESQIPLAPLDQRDSRRRICQHFANHGRCKFGSACKYQHERREHGSPRKLKAHTNPPKRKSLWQVMVEKEQEDDHRRALRAIIALGKQGLLDEPAQLD